MFSFLYSLPRHLSRDFTIEISFLWLKYTFDFFVIRLYALRKKGFFKYSDFRVLVMCLAYARLFPHDGDITGKIKQICKSVPFGINKLINLIPLGGRLCFPGGINMDFNLSDQDLSDVRKWVTNPKILFNARYNLEHALVYDHIQMVMLDIFTTSKLFYFNCFLSLNPLHYINHPDRVQPSELSETNSSVISTTEDEKTEDVKSSFYWHLHTMAYVPQMTYSMAATIIFCFKVPLGMIESVAVHLGCKYVHALEIDVHIGGLVTNALEFIFSEDFGKAKDFVDNKGSTPDSKPSTPKNPSPFKSKKDKFKKQADSIGSTPGSKGTVNPTSTTDNSNSDSNTVNIKDIVLKLVKDFQDFKDFIINNRNLRDPLLV